MSTALKYNFDDFPVAVQLEAFSPFIPHDEKNSGLPVGLFTFKITNTTKEELNLSIFNALMNFIGYSEKNKLSYMDYKDKGNLAYAYFRREGISDNCPSQGGLSIGVFSDMEGKASYVFHPRSTRDIWEPLREAGTLENADYGNYKGSTGNMGAESFGVLRKRIMHGVLCKTFNLKPGAELNITFAIDRVIALLQLI